MRKSVTLTIKDRDHEKIFVITEMSAVQLESWLIRAGLLLGRTGLLSADTQGLEAVADVAKVLASDGGMLEKLCAIDYAAAKPLLDEMMTCVKEKIDNYQRDFNPDTIEDVRTFFRLRAEIVKLHMGFLTPAAPSDSQPREQAAPARGARISPSSSRH